MDTMNENGRAYDALAQKLERAQAYRTALILFEWDNETLAPKAAGPYTAPMEGALSAAYQEIMTGKEFRTLLAQCDGESLNETEQAIVREAKEEVEKLGSIPPQEYRAYRELVSESTRIWVKAKQEKRFEVFAPTLKKVISYQKTFAGYRAKDGQKLYDVMLGDFEKGFTVERLDKFFSLVKRELVPLLQKVIKSGVEIDDSFLTGDYPEDAQRRAAEFIAEYVGFDFDRGVLAVSAHPFTTNLHNHDVRITTHYKKRMDSSLFSVIHESGHAIYEMNIRDDLTQTLVGYGASMGMHESQSRFLENIIGRKEAFWIPIYSKLQQYFPRQLKAVSCQRFVRAVNKVHPGLIRTEADELTYSLHVLVRYELEKALIEENLPVDQLPGLWADKYEEYLGIRPKNDAEGVLQDIHWAQGSFGYFPSYALGSAYGAQMYAFMKRHMDFEKLLAAGDIKTIMNDLRNHIHQYGKLKPSLKLLEAMTGETFNPHYYVDYLREKYETLYELK